MKNLFYLFCFFLCFQMQAQGFDDVEIVPTKVTDNIYMLEGAGGNIGLMVGEENVFMIDGQFADLTDKILAAIKEISDKPILYLINTHWHGDHTGGNENMHKHGTSIIAHENVRERMKTGVTMEFFQRQVPPSPDAALPDITFSNNMALHFEEEPILIYYFGAGHTNGDAVIYFAQSNVLHTGDLYFAGKYPFFDISSGGSIIGLINVLEKILFLADNKTKIIPGHGALSNKEELNAYYEMIKEIKQSVAVLVDAGKDLKTAKSLNLTQKYDAQYGDGFIKPEQIVELIFQSLMNDKGK